MPIQVSDYTWHQTEARIVLSLDLHNTSSKNVDIITTNSYLKVSFLPYIFEAFLCHMINADKSTARISNGRLEFDLKKETDALWSNLCQKLSQEEMKQRRKDVQLDIEKQEQKKSQLKKDQRTQRERFSVSQQISEDERLKKDHQTMIGKEKEEFMRMSSEGVHRSQSMRSRLSSTCSEEGTAIASEGDYDGDGEDSHYYSSTENLLLSGKAKFEKSTEITSKRLQRKGNSGRKGGTKDTNRSCDKDSCKEERKKGSTIPPVRCNGTIHVNYTKRVFPTPSRESKQEEEEEWLSAQMPLTSESDRDATGTVDFFKQKAVSLFENGDYRGCVNAYSEALQRNPRMASLYSNRAAANIALNNLHHAINDCSKALELLMPPTNDTTKSQLLCYIRRGTAFVGLGLYSEGLLDYRAALKLSPNDKNLLKDEQRIQAIMMASTDSGESNEEDTDAEGKG